MRQQLRHGGAARRVAHQRARHEVARAGRQAGRVRHLLRLDLEQRLGRRLLRGRRCTARGEGGRAAGPAGRAPEECWREGAQAAVPGSAPAAAGGCSSPAGAAHRLEGRPAGEQLVGQHADAPAVDLVGVVLLGVGLELVGVRLDRAVQDLRAQVVDGAQPDVWARGEAGLREAARHWEGWRRLPSSSTTAAARKACSHLPSSHLPSSHLPSSSPLLPAAASSTPGRGPSSTPAPAAAPGVGHLIAAVDGQPEVCQLDLVDGGHQDVLRLDVAVDHALAGGRGRPGSGCGGVCGGVVVWCGVVWCGVVWCGVVWCGVVWCGVVWCGVVWCGVGGQGAEREG